MTQQPTFSLLTAEAQSDYALLDFGRGRKLERFGAYIVDRPEEQAMCPPRLPEAEWKKADAYFDGDAEDKAGRWQFKKGTAENFQLHSDEIKFFGRFTAFRHMGFFPEQIVHWRWMKERIKRASKPFKLLNLFGYSGLASLYAASAGAEVTHVDASKKAVGYARENQELAGLKDKPIRWIVEDAVTFVEREKRRGNFYHGILLDPPKFGRGPNGETWNLFDDLPQHAADCVSILDEKASFLILTAYAIRASALSLSELLKPQLINRGGVLDVGELVLRTEKADRYLSTSLYCRWSAE